MKKVVWVSSLLASLLYAQSDYEMAVMLGGVKPEGNLNIDDSDQFVYGLRFQMNTLDLAGFVPEISFDRSTDTDYEYQAGETAINRLALNGLYEFDKEEKLRPYLLLGLGYEDVEDEPVRKYDSSMYGNWGGGIKWEVIENLALRLEAKHLIRTDDGGNELYYGVGLNFSFGGSSSDKAMPAKEELKQESNENAQEEAAVASTAVVAVVEKDSDGDGVLDKDDKCPTTPEGVKVDATGCCLDSDGDGVKDHKDACAQTPAGEKVDEKGCALDSDGDGVSDVHDKCPNTQAGEKVDANGCAASIVLDIHFENASANIDKVHSPKLEKYIEFMNNNTEYSVRIVGHTDSKGSEIFNQSLSQKRAEMVKQALVDGGVDASRVEAIGKGESEPIADNTTEEGRHKNRRIEAQLFQ